MQIITLNFVTYITNVTVDLLKVLSSLNTEHNIAINPLKPFLLYVMWKAIHRESVYQSVIILLYMDSAAGICPSALRNTLRQYNHFQQW